MKNTLFLGVDPGFTGAIAGIFRLDAAMLHRSLEEEFYDGGSFVFDLPVVGEKDTKRIDARQLAVDLDSYRDLVDLHVPTVALLEKAQVMPKQGGVSNFRYGGVYMSLHVVLELLGVKVLTVTPAKWKRDMGLSGKGKEASREMAMRLFPSLHGELARKKDADRAEALLLAEYLRMGTKGA